MNFIENLTCVTCNKTYAPDEIDYTCLTCGPIDGTLIVNYQYDRIKKEFSREKLKQNTNQTLWRYLPILPVSRAELIPSLSVGMSPLYRCDTLEKEWQCKSLWIKDDSRNPTASYKDRASAVAVVKALEKGVKTVTAASTGNAASSWSAFTALAKLETVIFVPETAPKAKVAQLLLFGAKVVKVKGTYDDAFDLCCQAADQWGWYNRSTAINPYLGEGKKTGALEICEQLNWNVPDYVFVSVGDGCIFQGLWKGFQDFYHLGLIERLPKIIGVQAEGSAPLVKAFDSNAAHATPLIPQTVADSISVGVPRDQVKALKAARESGGKFIAVSDDQILEAIRLLARKVGIAAEPAGATAFAGLKQALEKGWLTSNDSAAVFVTGNGLKDIDGVMKAVDQSPIVVEKSLDDVKEKLNIR